MRNILRLLFFRQQQQDSKHQITEVKEIRPPHPPSPPHHAAAGKWLSSALERAVELGVWKRAERIAESAKRLAPDHPDLSEQLARYHFARGDVKTALRTIDACHLQTASLRLLRNICLILLGRTAESQHDLLNWSRKTSAPVSARLVQALLVMQKGEYETARKWLKMNLTQSEDPLTLAALVVICIRQEQFDQARQWANRFYEASSWIDSPLDCDVFLKSLSLSRPAPAHQPGEDRIDTLSREILDCEEIIPVLVQAQRLQYDSRNSKLLGAAIERILTELDKPQTGYEALAQLAVVEENSAAARHWAEAGLNHQPMSASLSRLVQKLDKGRPDKTLSQVDDVLAIIGAKRDSHASMHPREAAA